MTATIDNPQITRLDAGCAMETALGRFYLGVRDGALQCGWQDSDDELVIDTPAMPDWAAGLPERLQSYFAGQDVDFSDVPLPDGPAFYLACWRACRDIPRGRVISYTELAQAAGATGRSARAAGQAMRRNPLPILTPCHRVVGSGWLGGYSGRTAGDSVFIRRKKALLELESADLLPRHA